MQTTNLSEEELMDCALEKAEFVLKTGIAPSEYDQLTQVEIEAFVRVFNKLNSK